MLDSLSPAALAAELQAARGPAPSLELATVLPRQAKTVRDTGLEPRLVNELVVKTIHAGGKTPLPVLSGKLRLSVSVLREVLGQLMAEQQVEVAWCGESDIDVQYQLTAIGQRSAAEYFAQSRYVGPAPVTLAAYRQVAESQSLRQPGAPRITPAQLACLLADDGLDPGLLGTLGAALHSNRPLLLYGPSGGGKTTLARKLGRLLQGAVAVPYAILVDRQIIQFHDPLLHPAPLPLSSRQQEDRRSCDARWAICQRPLVQVGAGLAREMLDLRHDAGAGVYRAPPHILANNGVLVVDDVGRQRLPVADMLNRWIGPIEQGVDQLSLPGGHVETVPFDVTVIFATNLPPDVVFDDAAMRRIGYKVKVGPLSEASYRNLLQRQCRMRDIAYDEAGAAHLARLHAQSGQPLLAGFPHELLGRIADFASFAGTEPVLTPAALDQAWASMFACGHAATQTGDQS